MPGPLKGPGKFWNIYPIWGYVLLILATNCAFWFSLYFQFDQTFLTPLPLLRKTFWSPPLLVTQNFFGPPPFCPAPPHQSIYERSLRTLFKISLFKSMLFKNSRVDKQKNELGRWKSRIVAIFLLFLTLWHVLTCKQADATLASLSIFKYGASKWPHRVIRGSKIKSAWNLFKSMSDRRPWLKNSKNVIIFQMRHVVLTLGV